MEIDLIQSKFDVKWGWDVSIVVVESRLSILLIYFPHKDRVKFTQGFLLSLCLWKNLITCFEDKMSIVKIFTIIFHFIIDASKKEERCLMQKCFPREKYLFKLQFPLCLFNGAHKLKIDRSVNRQILCSVC